MDINIAQKIVETGEDLGLDMTLRESYSGRGMYGKETAGIVCESMADLLQCAVELAYCIGSDTRDIDIGDLAEAMRRIKTDSMGLSMIIY